MAKLVPELAVLLSQREVRAVPYRSPSPEPVLSLESWTQVSPADDDDAPASAAGAGLARHLSAIPVSQRPSALEALVAQRAQALDHADLAKAVAKALSGLEDAQATAMLFRLAQSLAGHPQRLALIFQGLCHGAIEFGWPADDKLRELAGQLEAVLDGLLSARPGGANMLMRGEADAALAVLMRWRTQLPLPALCLLTQVIARHIPAHRCEALLMQLARAEPGEESEADDAPRAAAMAVPIAGRLLAQDELAPQTVSRLLLKVGQLLGHCADRAERGLALAYAIGHACALSADRLARVHNLVHRLLVRDGQVCHDVRHQILKGLSLSAGASYLQTLRESDAERLVGYRACALPADLHSVYQDLMTWKPTHSLVKLKLLRLFESASGYQPLSASALAAAHGAAGERPFFDDKARPPSTAGEGEVDIPQGSLTPARRARSVSERGIVHGSPQGQGAAADPEGNRQVTTPADEWHTQDANDPTSSKPDSPDRYVGRRRYTF